MCCRRTGRCPFRPPPWCFSPPASADPRGTCSSPSFSLSGVFEHRLAQHWDQHLLLDRGDVDGAMSDGHVKDSPGGSSLFLVTGNEATSIMRALHTSLCLSSGFPGRRIWYSFSFQYGIVIVAWQWGRSRRRAAIQAQATPASCKEHSIQRSMMIRHDGNPGKTGFLPSCAVSSSPFPLFIFEGFSPSSLQYPGSVLH